MIHTEWTASYALSAAYSYTNCCALALRTSTPQCWISYRKLRYIEISNVRRIASNVLCLPPPGTPAFLMLTLNESFQVSNIEMISSTLFLYRYYIEIDPDLDVRCIRCRYRIAYIYCVPVSYQNRFRYRYPISNISIVLVHNFRLPNSPLFWSLFILVHNGPTNKKWPT